MKLSEYVFNFQHFFFKVIEKCLKDGSVTFFIYDDVKK